MGFALGVIFGVILTVALEFGMFCFWTEVKKDIRKPYYEPRYLGSKDHYDKGYKEGFSAGVFRKAREEAHDIHEQIKKEENE